MNLPMMRHEGDRAAVVAELRTRAEGWSHLCKEALSEASTAAAEAVEGGADQVTVGHTEFVVIG